MIRSLQKKFILIAMTCFVCVTALILATVNVANFLRIDRRAGDLLEMISTLREPGEHFRPSRENGAEPPPPGTPPERPWFSGLHGDFKSISITPETEFTTRWFSVTFAADGRLLNTAVEKIASVSREEAEVYGREVFDSNDDEGYSGFFKYRSVAENDTVTVYFLDCENELRSGLFLLVITFSVGVAVLILLSVLITLFSRRAVAPVIENMERQKRFITDAGHELKTPLAIISANADVLSLTGEGNEWVDSIRNQTERMGNLVQDLLTLARGEELRDGEKISFNLSDAVLETAMPFEALAKARGKTVSFRAEPDITMVGDEGALRRLTSILMENALKYADEGSEISLALFREGKRTVLLQKNSCTPLPDGETLRHLFDRFYRADPSRSREKGGFGIGLSIADGIVRAHKGKISAYGEDGKICFKAVF